LTTTSSNSCSAAISALAISSRRAIAASESVPVRVTTGQFADRRRRHEDQSGLRDRRSYRPRALQLDLEDDIIARCEPAFYVVAQRAVQVPP